MLTEEPGRSPLYLLNVLRHPSEVAGQWGMKGFWLILNNWPVPTYKNII